MGQPGLFRDDKYMSTASEYETNTAHRKNQRRTNWSAFEERLDTRELRRARHIPRWKRFVRENLYLASSFPVALCSFIVVCTLVSLGAGLVPLLLLGVPVLWGTLYYGRGASSWERHLVGWVRSRDVSTPYPPRKSVGALDRLRADASHGQSWMNLAWILVDFVISTVVFWLTFTWWMLALMLVAGPIMMWLFSIGLIHEDGNGRLVDLLSVEHIPWITDHPYLAEGIAYAVVGAAFVLTLMPLVHGLSILRAVVSESMLCLPVPSRHRIEDLKGSRAASRRAEIDAMRRLERDIHDGPQQRLVRLEMDLARAERIAENDPRRAMEILRGAKAQSRETLMELRQLARGIAPAILVDRGLHAAVTETASRSQIPVQILWDVRGGLPPHVETTAYFVISECLVNANKHSSAQHAQISVHLDDAILNIEVRDDGVGGAAAAKGHGLAGLTDRVKGADGQFTVYSPHGGPTTIECEIPCEP